MNMWTDWLNHSFLGNSMVAYIRATFELAAIFLILMLLKQLLISRLGKLTSKTADDFDAFLVSSFAQIGVPVFVVIALFMATLSLELPETFRKVIHRAFVLVVTFRLLLLLQEIVRYSATKMCRRRISADNPSSEAMVRTVSGILRWVIWSWGLIFVLDNWGINISALAAGLGIGGVAVAIASQAVLGDFFSALSIFLDKPFVIGDFIIVDDHMGTVEYIGIKTTRIRSLSGEQLIFSNSDLTKSRIKNYKRMADRRVVFKIGVVYQTPLAKMRLIPAFVKGIFQSMEGVRLDRVHFQSFGDFALNFEIVYYVQSADYNIYMDKQQTINFALMQLFEQEGIEFAYPTQTLYLNKQAAPLATTRGDVG